MNKHFWRHYAGMVLAMGLSMAVLGPVRRVLTDAVGWSAVSDRTEPLALVMAVEMSIGMAAWMRFRGHAWRPILEMCAAMFASFLVLFIPYWLGFVGKGAVLMGGHLLMLPAMVLVMLLRVEEYGHPHASARRSQDAQGCEVPYTP